VTPDNRNQTGLFADLLTTSKNTQMSDATETSHTEHHTSPIPSASDTPRSQTVFWWATETPKTMMSTTSTTTTTTTQDYSHTRQPSQQNIFPNFDPIFTTQHFLNTTSFGTTQPMKSGF
jgi:hypothetical protein